MAVVVPLLISPQAPPFRVQTELVAVNVTVTNAKGDVVRGLNQDAFTVTEDGQTATVAQFANEAVPVSLVVALDASSSMAGGRIKAAREAILDLLDRLGPDDEFYVLGFDYERLQHRAGNEGSRRGGATAESREAVRRHRAV